MATEEESWEDAHSEIERRMQERGTEMIEGCLQESERTNEKSEWKGDDMGKKMSTTGLRIATQNFERQLYATEEAQDKTAENIKRHNIDILVCFEPGKGSHENQVRMHNRTHGDELGTELEIINRNYDTTGGGVIVWITGKWASIPRETRQLKADDAEINGRAMAIEFHNDKQGEHHRMLLMAVHGINNANSSPESRERTQKILTWINQQKESFTKKYPKATIVMATDINAAKHTRLDTDRKGDFPEGQLEPDAYVIQKIEGMKLSDVFRTAFPNLKAVTRRATHTNRLLDRIFATNQAAEHPETRVAIHKADS